MVSGTRGSRSAWNSESGIEKGYAPSTGGIVGDEVEGDGNALIHEFGGRANLRDETNEAIAAPRGVFRQLRWSGDDEVIFRREVGGRG